MGKNGRGPRVWEVGLHLKGEEEEASGRSVQRLGRPRPCWLTGGGAPPLLPNGRARRGGGREKGRLTNGLRRRGKRLKFKIRIQDLSGLSNSPSFY